MNNNDITKETTNEYRIIKPIFKLMIASVNLHDSSKSEKDIITVYATGLVNMDTDELIIFN